MKATKLNIRIGFILGPVVMLIGLYFLFSKPHETKGLSMLVMGIVCTCNALYMYIVRHRRLLSQASKAHN